MATAARAALPQGLALGDALAVVGAGGRQPEPRHGQEESVALPGWLVPLLALSAIAVGWYLWDQNRKARQDGEVIPAPLHPS